jgi:sulfatase maturation enzyme AslB (radical SAM superfamily)
MALEWITVVLTTGCNLRCEYCYLQRPPRATISWSRLQAALDALLPAIPGHAGVMFTGGEPLLALPLLRRTVAHVRATLGGTRRVVWEIATNGLLLTDEAVDLLDRHGFVVSLSFDGAAAAQAVRGRGTFERLDALLRRLRRVRPSFLERLTVAMTVSPPTVPVVAESVDYFLATGVGRIDILPSVPGTGWTTGSIILLDAQIATLRRRLRSHYELTGTVPVTFFRKEGRKAPPPGWICGVARCGGVTVDVDGCGYGCVVASRSYQPRTPPALLRAVEALALGPVDAPDFERRLAAMPDRARACGGYTHPEERYSSYRRCRDCEFLGRCYACPLAGASDPGWDDVRRVPDFVCAWNQVTLAHRDRFAAETGTRR